MVTMLNLTSLTWGCSITIMCVIMLSQTFYSSICPLDKESWKKKESVFTCNHLVYHCGISVHGKEIEFCASPMFIRKGFCPLFDVTRNLKIVEEKCIHHDGCPLEGYVTNELYKYPSCLNISLECTMTPKSFTKSNSTKYHNSLIFTKEYSEMSEIPQYMTSKSIQITSSESTSATTYTNFDITHVSLISGSVVFFFLMFNVFVVAYVLRIKRKMKCHETTSIENAIQPHVITIEDIQEDGVYEEIKN